MSVRPHTFDLHQILRSVRSFEFGHLQNSGDLSMEYTQYLRIGANYGWRLDP